MTTALLAIEGIVLLLLLVLVAGLLRSHAEILRRLHALGAGEEVEGRVPLSPTRRAVGEVPVAAVAGVTPAGAAATVAVRGSRGFTLLAFLSTGCTTCRPLWSSLPESLEAAGVEVRPLVVARGPEHESPSELARLAPRTARVVMSDEAWDAFRVPGTPYFVLVDAAAGSVLGEGSAASWAQVSSLAERALGDGRPDGLHRSTGERLRDSDDELTRAGIEPGDPSLFHRPEAT